MTENSAPKKGLTNAQASALQPRDIIIQEVTDNFIKTSLPTMRAKNIPKALPPVISSTNKTIPTIEKISADNFFKVTFSLKNKIQIK